MNFILNIGLKSETLGDITAQQALNAVNAADVFVYGSQVFESDTEPTLVLSADFKTTKYSIAKTITALAKELGQDCIAIWLPEWNRGELHGPKAAAWGDFNPEFFLMPDGQPLVQATKIAA